MSHSKYMRIAFDEEIDFMDEVLKLKVYHQKCLSVISDIENGDVQDVKDKCASGEILLPKRPTCSLAKLLEITPCKNNNLEKLNSKLIDLLVQNFEVSDLTLPNKSDEKAVFSFLTKCSSTIKKYKAKQFFLCAAFGLYLDIYFTSFNKSVKEESWGAHIKKHFKISESHGRNLRMVGKLVNTHPKLQKLSITFREFVKMRKQITNLMDDEKYKSFWQSSE